MKYQIGFRTTVTKPEYLPGCGRINYAYIELFLRSSEYEEFEGVAELKYQHNVDREESDTDKWYGFDLNLTAHNPEYDSTLDRYEYVLKLIRKIKNAIGIGYLTPELVNFLKVNLKAKEVVYDKRVSQFIPFEKLMPLDVYAYGLFYFTNNGERQCMKYFYDKNIDGAKIQAVSYLQENINWQEKIGKYPGIDLYKEQLATYKEMLVNLDVTKLNYCEAPTEDQLVPIEVKLGFIKSEGEVVEA